jgi:glycosyltransferase involved in cell wall biosynthesis
MSVIYVNIGEDRLAYGSAAALSQAKHQTYVINPNMNLSSIKPSYSDIEIGCDLKTKRVKVKTIDVPTNVLAKNELKWSSKEFFNVVRSVDAEVLITGRGSWFAAKRAAKKLNIPLLLWNTAAYSIFKLFLFLANRAYLRSLEAPFGFVYLTYIGLRSGYVMTNDVVSTKIMHRFGIKHVELIWPTYARFAEKTTHADLLSQTDFVHTGEGDQARGVNPYVLSFIPLNLRPEVYKTELRSLKFVRDVALALPDLNFVVVGASAEAVQNQLDLAKVKNLTLISRHLEEAEISALYKNAVCILSVYRLPGFSNRLMDAFFYGKAIITTSLTNKYYGDLLANRDVVFADNPGVAVEALKKISLNECCKRELEDASLAYYLSHYLPEKHAEAVERLFERMGCKKRR